MSNIFHDFDRPESKPSLKEKEFSRILTAAVVSEKFRKLLLSDPEMAVRMGFGGEAFHLDHADTRRLASIRATSLADFARQMNNTGAMVGIPCTAAD